MFTLWWKYECIWHILGSYQVSKISIDKQASHFKIFHKNIITTLFFSLYVQFFLSYWLLRNTIENVCKQKQGRKKLNKFKKNLTNELFSNKSSFFLQAFVFLNIYLVFFSCYQATKNIFNFEKYCNTWTLFDVNKLQKNIKIWTSIMKNLFSNSFWLIKNSLLIFPSINLRIKHFFCQTFMKNLDVLVV